MRQVPTNRDNTFNYRVRSGVTFRLAGEIERAWPILLEATTFDWQAAGIPEDDHFTEWAFVEMLCVLAEREAKFAFAELFRHAVARCAELGSPFPSIKLKQEQLLDWCEFPGLERELTHVIERIQSQGNISRRLARRMAQLKLCNQHASEPCS
jgi:hypothetical protein